MKAIRKALPGNDAGYASWAYLFAVGALVMSVFDSRIERISGGKVKAGDVQRKSEYLVSFIAAGIRAGMRTGKSSALELADATTKLNTETGACGPVAIDIVRDASVPWRRLLLTAEPR